MDDVDNINNNNQEQNDEPVTTTTATRSGDNNNGQQQQQQQQQHHRSTSKNNKSSLFRARQGKQLTWSNVNMSVQTTKGGSSGKKKKKNSNKRHHQQESSTSTSSNTKKQILKDVWGSAGNDEVTAILGPSGSGKTSLLNVLAGRVSSNFQVSAQIELGGQTIHPNTDSTVRKHIAFVEQQDTLHVAATPRESIHFSAKLRLPKTTTEHDIDQLVEHVISALGLSDCADTITGGATVKGISEQISGGERKRVSIGVELVTHPSLIFLDEPTSGLDSFSALQLAKILQQVAATGASVLLTIHQPASDILSQLDRIILLKNGRVMYQGKTEMVSDYFAARHHPLPPKYNPADWMLIVAQTTSEDELEKLGYFPSGPEATREYEQQQQQQTPPPVVASTDENVNENRDDDDIEKQKESASAAAASSSSSSSTTANIAVTTTPPLSSSIKEHVSMGTQISYLLKRDFRSIVRDKMVLGARMMLTCFMSVMASLIFLRVGDSAILTLSILQSQFGATMMVVMTAMFGSALPTLLVFPEERPVFIREYSTNHYSVFSYFGARLVLEAFLTACQMLFLAFLTYFMMAIRQRFFWYFLTLYTLAMASTAIAMVVGSAVKDPKLAIEFMPMVFIPQILFAGFFIAPDLIPVWLRWLRWLMPMAYGIRIALANEFGHGCGKDEADELCENLLRDTDVDVDDVWWYWLCLVGIFVVLRIMALHVLRHKAVRYK